MNLTELLEYIDGIPSSTLLVGMIIFGVVVGWFLSNRKDIKSVFDSWYQTKKRKDEILQMILDDHDRMGEYENNRLKDREQSFEIQKQLIDANTKLAMQLADLSKMVQENQSKIDKRFEESEEKNNKRVRAELKDKIGRTYRYHHDLKKINDIEFEALKDLIEEYECAGGTNSFVHDLVIPEMYHWEIATRD